MADNVPVAAPPDGVTSDFHGVSDVQYMIRTTIGITLGLATLVSGLRLYTSIWLIKKFEWEDPLILLAYLAAVAYNVLNLLILEHGWGQHIWNVTIAQLDVYLQLVTPITILYMVSPSLSKLALMAVYYRTIIEQRFRLVVYSLASSVIIYTAVLIGLVAGPCSATGGSGQCLPEATLAYIVMNISTDVMLIVLPLPVIHSLNMPWRQKTMVGVVLTVGSLTVVASIIRAAYSKQITTATDFTYNSAGPWTIVEVNLAVTCNCLIRLQPLVMKLLSLLGISGSPKGSGLSGGLENRGKPRTKSSGRNGSSPWRGDGAEAEWEMQHFESRGNKEGSETQDVEQNAGAIMVKREFEVQTSIGTISRHGSTEEIIRKAQGDQK